jgi:lysophospholipase L1-like esterase
MKTGWNLQVMILTAVLFLSCDSNKREILYISCAGDSITEGAGLSRPTIESYPAVMEDILGGYYVVSNYGKSGACAQDIEDGSYRNTMEFERLVSDTIPPGLILIMLGTNDSKARNWQDGETFKSEYNSLIDIIQHRFSGAEIKLCLPPPAFNDSFGISGEIIKNNIIPVISEISGQRGFDLIDCHTPLLEHEEFFPDGIHPDSAGAVFIAQIVSEAILEAYP